MRHYTASDLNPMSWEEYGRAVQSLLSKISGSGATFDAIAPIFRSGGIPGSMLAIHLRIPRVIPLQFKYAYDPERLIEMISTHQISKTQTPANILICENNTSSGETARAAVALLRKWFPKAKLSYATVALVFTNERPELPGVDALFWGIQTNERFEASDAQWQSLSLRRGITLFPWENAQDEVGEMNRVPNY